MSIQLAIEPDAPADVRRDAYHGAKLKFNDQDKKVLCALFYFSDATALSLHRILKGELLLTSLRRSLSGLKKKEFIVPTGKRMELLRAENTTYRITKNGEKYLWPENY